MRLIIDLPEETDSLLSEMALERGITREEFARLAVLRGIEDRDGAIAAETAYREFLESGEKSIPLHTVMEELGLER